MAVRLRLTMPVDECGCHAHAYMPPLISAFTQSQLIYGQRLLPGPLCPRHDHVIEDTKPGFELIPY